MTFLLLYCCTSLELGIFAFDVSPVPKIAVSGSRLAPLPFAPLVKASIYADLVFLW
jgi:hypothetical protein